MLAAAQTPTLASTLPGWPPCCPVRHTLRLSVPKLFPSFSCPFFRSPFSQEAFGVLQLEIFSHTSEIIHKSDLALSLVCLCVFFTVGAWGRPYLQLLCLISSSLSSGSDSD